MKLILALLIVCTTVTGMADCRCQCVDGLPRTLCTTITEAKSRVNLCGSGSIQCPELGGRSEAPKIKRYSPALEGAYNCRDVLLYDSANGDYTAQAKACDTKDEPREKK